MASGMEAAGASQMEDITMAAVNEAAIAAADPAVTVIADRRRKGGELTGLSADHQWQQQPALHTHMHTCTHAHMHACIHAYMQTLVHALS